MYSFFDIIAEEKQTVFGCVLVFAFIICVLVEVTSLSLGQKSDLN